MMDPPCHPWWWGGARLPPQACELLLLLHSAVLPIWPPNTLTRFNFQAVLKNSGWSSLIKLSDCLIS